MDRFYVQNSPSILPVVSTSALLLFAGKITGISGILHTLLNGQDGGWKSWRSSYLFGLLVSGPIVAMLSSNALGTFGSFRESALQYLHPIPVVISGLLVGFGSRLGNGCTSGHGLCALPRLSPRSFVAVCTFMATGAAMTALVRYTKLGEYLFTNNHPGHWGWAVPASMLVLSYFLFSAHRSNRVGSGKVAAGSDGLISDPHSSGSGGIVSSELDEQRRPLTADDDPHADESKGNNSRRRETKSVASPVVASPIAPKTDKPVVHLVSFLCALAFGVGLGVSGMTNPSKIHGFLDFGAIFGAGKGISQWDPTLIGVMGGAVMLNVVFFQLLSRYVSRPLCYKAKVPTSPPPSPAHSKDVRCDPCTQTCPAMCDVLVMGPKAAANRVIDAPLVIGSALFGVGWGFAGICPGPGLVSLSAGAPHAPLFCGSMMLGMVLFEKLYAERKRR